MSSTQEIVKVEATRPIAQLSFNDMRQLAADVAKSGLFSCRTTEAALTLMMLAQAENLHPIQAMRQFHIIEGRPSMRADAMQARFMQAGGRIKWVERSDQRCAAEFTHPLTGTQLFEWTIQDAVRAGLANKDVWRKYPRALLTARVVSEGVRAMDPGVVCGLYTPEEVHDFDAPIEPPPPLPRQTRSAKEQKKPAEQPAREEPVVNAAVIPLATTEQIAEMRDLVNIVTLPDGLTAQWLKKAGVSAWEQMPFESMVKCLEYLRQKADAQVAGEGRKNGEEQPPAAEAGQEQEPAGQEKPDLSTWDNFMKASARAAEIHGLQDMVLFADGIGRAVLGIGKKGKEDSITLSQRERWYEAIVAGAFDFATGRINQAEMALRS